MTTNPRIEFREWLDSQTYLAQKEMDAIADKAASIFAPGPPAGEVGSELAMVTCPECNGSGKSNLIPLCVREFPPGHKLTDDDAKALAEHLSTCQFCDGDGKVSERQVEWRRIGEQWREARNAIRVGMREWSQRVGCLPSDYYDMESGRTKPEARYSPFQVLPDSYQIVHGKRAFISDRQISEHRFCWVITDGLTAYLGLDGRWHAGDIPLDQNWPSEAAALAFLKEQGEGTNGET